MTQKRHFQGQLEGWQWSLSREGKVSRMLGRSLLQRLLPKLRQGFSELIWGWWFLLSALLFAFLMFVVGLYVVSFFSR